MTTPTQKTPDYFRIPARRCFFRYKQAIPPTGIRFLKENIPQIETLEYPSWREFERKLEESWDVVGISFLMKDIPVVKKMIELARLEGVKEIWGGGYGILCDEMRGSFDRTFVGHAENEVSELLTGKRINRIRHPSIVTVLTRPYFPLIREKHGLIFVSRGCNFRCSFCQMPVFVRERTLISLESIREALENYEKKGVKCVTIMNEISLLNRGHSAKVIELIQEFGFTWGCETRLDILKGRVNELKKKGLISCIVGIESLRQKNLNFINKRLSVETILQTIKELRDNDIGVLGMFTIGYPTDTEKDIREEIERLSSLDIQHCHFPILTPFPHTALWEELSKYGPFDPDYSKYDCTHLIWNHPTISPERMREVFFESYANFDNRWRHLKNLFPDLFAQVAGRR